MEGVKVFNVSSIMETDQTGVQNRTGTICVYTDILVNLSQWEWNRERERLSESVYSVVKGNERKEDIYEYLDIKICVCQCERKRKGQ